MPHWLALTLKICLVWCLISFALGLLLAGCLNRISGRCFSHGNNRRLVIQTEGYEYYECPVCGTREADKIYGLEGDYPVNYAWINGASWF